MANFVFNIAKGQVGGYFQRVDDVTAFGGANSSTMSYVVLKSPLASDGTLQDLDSLSAVLGASPEVANSGYARLTHNGATTGFGPFSPNDTNDWFDYDVPDLSYTSVTTGDLWR